MSDDNLSPFDAEESGATRDRRTGTAPLAPTRAGSVADPAGRRHAAAPAGAGDEAQAGISPARLRAEAENAWHNELYLLAPIGYFLIGLDAALLQANIMGAEMLGIDRHRLAGLRLRSFVAPAFWPDFDAFVGRALNSPTPEHCRVQMLRAGGGAPFPVTLLGSADGSGQACRLAVEPARGRQEALERNEERFRRIVHAALEGIWEIDAAAITTFVNPKMAQILGYEIEEMQGRALTDFMDDEGRAILDRNVARRRAGIAERHDFKFKHKQGGDVWTTMATNPIFDDAGVYQGALALVTDITEQRQHEEQTWRHANFDELTGLPNRHMFTDRLRVAARRADRGDGLLALLFIDLDHFKDVNDRLGHAMGDAVLVQAAQRIAACVRSSDTLARLGGDEFTVILGELEHPGVVERIAQDMLNRLAAPFMLGGDPVHVSASIGIALYPPDAGSTGDLLVAADQAMYAAKHAGRNGFSYFTPDLQQAAQGRRQLASELREALAGAQFEVLYQPIVSLRDGVVRKAEALLRWNHPQRGLLEPEAFMPHAEASGLLVEIGDWAFRTAARQAVVWTRALDRAFQVCVNKAAVQFRREAQLYQSWIDYLAELGLPADAIAIEIKEGVLQDSATSISASLAQYRQLGLQLALDDFGTGYSSLAQLASFGLDYVKLDRSLVLRIEQEGRELALCEGIIALAHKLGLLVVAEGVETRLQCALLADAGCDLAQGYWFAPPVRAGELEALARRGAPDLLH